MLENNTKIALTQYAHGSGCGSKIDPSALKEIIHSRIKTPINEKLIVGNGSNDDAAVYDLGNGSALIATTDFFMPIVDDAYDFGRIAAANAISDVYAMGGKPTLALAILGWPINKLSTEIANQVLEGARAVCLEAGIPLAGGHSIDTLEPMFGLSVNGLIDISQIKKNNSANLNDLIFITKPIGVGVLSTAQKKQVLRPEDEILLIKQLTQLNFIGEKLAKINGVSAMTDVTGFGLIGHLIEMAEGSNLTAELNYKSIPKIDSLPYYISKSCVPDATYRNWNAYSNSICFSKNVDVAEAFTILPDPQTNGGILFSANPSCLKEIQDLLIENNLQNFIHPIGKMVKTEEKIIRIEE